MILKDHLITVFEYVVDYLILVGFIGGLALFLFGDLL